MDKNEVLEVISRELVVGSFVTIIILSAVSNLCIIVVFIANKKNPQSVTSIFIMSLSVSDFLVGVGVTLLAMLQILYPGITFGLACKLPPFMELLCVTASVYSLVFVSLDRYLAVVHATSRKLSYKISVLIAVGVWIWACLYSSRVFLQFSVDFLGPDLERERVVNVMKSDNLSPTIQGLNAEQVGDWLMTTTPWSEGSGVTHQDVISSYEAYIFCNLLVEKDGDDLLFRVLDLFVLFIFPFMVMTIMYARVGKCLWFSRIAVNNVVRRKRKIVKVLVVFVVVFFVSWVPFYIIDIVSDSIKVAMDNESADLIEENRTYIICRFFFILLSLSNSFINPILFAYYNKSFTDESKRFLCNIVKCLRKARQIEPLARGDNPATNHITIVS